MRKGILVYIHGKRRENSCRNIPFDIKRRSWNAGAFEEKQPVRGIGL